MDNTQKTLVLGFSALLIIVIIVWVFMQKKPTQAQAPQVFVLPNGNTTSNSSEVNDLKTQIQLLKDKAEAQEMQGNDSFPLKPGSVGDNVKKLQTFLKKKYGFQGKIDGKYGFQTNFAVEQNMKMKTIPEAVFMAYELQNIPI